MSLLLTPCVHILLNISVYHITIIALHLTLSTEFFRVILKSQMHGKYSVCCFLIALETRWTA